MRTSVDAITCRHVRIIAVAGILLSGSVRASSAQMQMPMPEPYGGLVAISAQVGGAVPREERLDNGLYTGATLLISITSHVAVTAEAGANHVDIDRPGFRSDLMPRFADLNLLVNWRRGPFRPFISGGVGVYRYTIALSSEAFLDPALRSSLLALGLTPTTSTRIELRHDERGINLGSGYEYFFSPRSALMMDVRAHVIRRPFVQIASFSGDFLNATIGFRQYF